MLLKAYMIIVRLLSKIITEDRRKGNGVATCNPWIGVKKNTTTGIIFTRLPETPGVPILRLGKFQANNKSTLILYALRGAEKLNTTSTTAFRIPRLLTILLMQFHFCFLALALTFYGIAVPADTTETIELTGLNMDWGAPTITKD
ncbi:hypothetical protein B0H13DRAFT_1861720 [Mycena leptocephala]|nr:hypothetical protein B0H13DRAFT_1861720 [Mycena leptocephala]